MLKSDQHGQQVEPKKANSKAASRWQKGGTSSTDDGCSTLAGWQLIYNGGLIILGFFFDQV